MLPLFLLFFFPRFLTEALLLPHPCFVVIYLCLCWLAGLSPGQWTLEAVWCFPLPHFLFAHHLVSGHPALFSSIEEYESNVQRVTGLAQRSEVSYARCAEAMWMSSLAIWDVKCTPNYASSWPAHLRISLTCFFHWHDASLYMFRISCHWKTKWSLNCFRCQMCHNNCVHCNILCSFLHV